MNRNYELVVILDPELTAAEQEKLLEKFKKLITDAEGKVSSAKELGKKELAYPIKKKREGVFYLLEFSAPASLISSLRQKLLLEDKVLRFLVIVREETYKEAKGKK